MSGHGSGLLAYFLVFAALMVLTALTVAIGFVQMGAWNDVVALAIATTKALLVILIFMHVRGSSRMTKLSIAAGALWLAILIGITLTDYWSRGLLD